MTWFDELVERFLRPRPRRSDTTKHDAVTDSPALFDSSGASFNSFDNLHEVSPSDSPSSFESAYDGGESGGAGASADFGGGWDGGGGDSSGGDSGGGGDGGGGGGGD